MNKIGCLPFVMYVAGSCLAQSYFARWTVMDADMSNNVERVERINSLFDEQYARDAEGLGICALLSASVERGGDKTGAFAFRASTNCVAVFASELDGLQGGELGREIEQKLGKPTFRLARSRERTDFSRGVCLKYYVARKDWNYIDERSDTYVALYLDASNRLEKIIAAQPLVKILDRPAE